MGLKLGVVLGKTPSSTALYHAPVDLLNQQLQQLQGQPLPDWSLSTASDMPIDSAPSRLVLETALRNAVQQVYDSGNLENLTVKRVRKAAEEQLGLAEGYFKNGSFWPEASKQIIQFEVVRTFCFLEMAFSFLNDIIGS